MNFFERLAYGPAVSERVEMMFWPQFLAELICVFIIYPWRDMVRGMEQ